MVVNQKDCFSIKYRFVIKKCNMGNLHKNMFRVWRKGLMKKNAYKSVKLESVYTPCIKERFHGNLMLLLPDKVKIQNLVINKEVQTDNTLWCKKWN